MWFCYGTQVTSPAMTRAYGLPAFRNDLKALLTKAGVERKPVTSQIFECPTDCDCQQAFQSTSVYLSFPCI